MMDADIEVRIVSHETRHMEAHFRLPDELGLDFLPELLFRQEMLKAPAQCSLRLGATGEPRIENGLRKVLLPILVEEVRNCAKIKDEVTNGDTRSAPALTRREDSQGEVLDWKVAPLRTLAPAGELRLVTFADHGSLAFGKPAHAMS
jgi:hypothetical protein